MATKRRPKLKVNFPIDKITSELHDALNEALRKEVHYIKVRSNFFCPKKTGNLVNSWREEYFPNERRAVFGYTAPYAWVQHERDYKHKPPTRKKYLWLAIESRKPFMREHFAKILKEKFGG